MLLKMALFHSLWLSNIPLCVCVCICICMHIYVYMCIYIHTHTYIISSLSICQWKFRLFPCLGYCTYCCYEDRGACIFLNYSFVWVYWVGLLDHVATLFLGFYYYNFCSELFKSKLHAWCPLTPKYFTNYCLRTRALTFITRIQW